jgi:hypothetical protein
MTGQRCQVACLLALGPPFVDAHVRNPRRCRHLTRPSVVVSPGPRYDHQPAALASSCWDEGPEEDRPLRRRWSGCAWSASPLKQRKLPIPLRRWLRASRPVLPSSAARPSTTLPGLLAPRSSSTPTPPRSQSGRRRSPGPRRPGALHRPPSRPPGPGPPPPPRSPRPQTHHGLETPVGNGPYRARWGRDGRRPPLSRDTATRRPVRYWAGGAGGSARNTCRSKASAARRTVASSAWRPTSIIPMGRPCDMAQGTFMAG